MRTDICLNADIKENAHLVRAAVTGVYLVEQQDSCLNHVEHHQLGDLRSILDVQQDRVHFDNQEHQGSEEAAQGVEGEVRVDVLDSPPQESVFPEPFPQVSPESAQGRGVRSSGDSSQPVIQLGEAQVQNTNHRRVLKRRDQTEVENPDSYDALVQVEVREVVLEELQRNHQREHGELEDFGVVTRGRRQSFCPIQSVVYGEEQLFSEVRLGDGDEEGQKHERCDDDEDDALQSPEVYRDVESVGENGQDRCNREGSGRQVRVELGTGGTQSGDLEEQEEWFEHLELKTTSQELSASCTNSNNDKRNCNVDVFGTFIIAESIQ